MKYPIKYSTGGALKKLPMGPITELFDYSSIRDIYKTS